MASNKWQLKTHRFGESIKKQYVENIRTAVNQGITEAVRMTYQDSSNAAVHWMVGVDHSKTSMRADTGNPIGAGTDMRGTKTAPPKHPIVGYREDEGSNAANAIRYVPGREFVNVIGKYIVGAKPRIDVYLYNALANDKYGNYQLYANLPEAGRAGIQRMINMFKAQTRTRKRSLD